MSKCSYCVYRNGWDCGDGYYRVSDDSLCENFKLDFDTLSDVVERKRGEWEEIEIIADAYDISGVKTWASKMMCKQCGFTTIAIEGHFSQYNYCPNCGVDMRGERDD